MMSDEPTRFVILYHEMPEGDPRQDHLDLMVEIPGSNPPVLATWAIENRDLNLHSPEDFAEPAVRLPDHRIEYLQYEGALSGNRGSVRRVIAGVTRWFSFDVPVFELELADNTWQVTASSSAAGNILKFQRRL